MSSVQAMSRFKGSSSARFVKNNGARTARISNVMSRFEEKAKTDAIDAVMGFDKYESGPKRVGWLINIQTTVIADERVANGLSGCDLYFLDQEGGYFKTTIQYCPYFYVVCKKLKQLQVEELMKKTLLEGLVKSYSRAEKHDLALPNHLTGLQQPLLKLQFHNQQDMQEARRVLNPIVQENRARLETDAVYTSFNPEYAESRDAGADIEDIREYDVPYRVRVSIDKDLRVGKWYSVRNDGGEMRFAELDIVVPPDPVILAFDIETTKAPLKFPDAKVDRVMMISYMVDGEGFLITNREIISKDIEDFEYSPKPEYPGVFEIYNARNEEELLRHFFAHIREVKPTVMVTFNGDFFDWPFIDIRSQYHNISMYDEIGFQKDSEDEYKSSYCCHMDCYRWVKRDSYLPQGSQGLKAVTTVKLGYNPIELDPELMTPYAMEKPQVLSEYSVSDAVATYYLYYKYIHPFIFSLSTILPLIPDEVLRKGTGTLCEMLLSVQAYQNDILLPNKHVDALERFYDGHLLESETYVGGHVESLEAGVFRSDLQEDFKIDTTVVDMFQGQLDKVLDFFITVESGKSVADCVNKQDVHATISTLLADLKHRPARTELPLIYHVDVASMYPNIMITNRLQPDSIKAEEDCAACDFNKPNKLCDRNLDWNWRGEYYPTEANEYLMIKRAIQNEQFEKNGRMRLFNELGYPDQVAHVKKRISDYSRKVYHRIKTSKVVTRTSIVCQRENPFYIDTVRGFRDRRYTYKGLAKKWKKKLGTINKADQGAVEDAKKMVIAYDSLQLAHKVILNSFYGYVMRKGSRWYSMEMAGITCATGSTIIQQARATIERFGRPLEIDTDGIWCIIPSSFPDEYELQFKDGSKLSVSYLCSLMNYLVHENFTNSQYHNVVDGQVKIEKENLIFFELDGPYKAMILPTSKEEGKGIKKRYAVFNYDGSLAELKGFELKRRGELSIVKSMQSDLFPGFLQGQTLEQCYSAVSSIANKWLDILLTKGKNIEQADLLHLIGERKTMSKSIHEYHGMKSTSITTVKRLIEFLGIEVKGDSGVTAQFVIADRPRNAPVAERAIPIAIFSADVTQQRTYLRRWLKDNNLETFELKAILDWDYYFERLASVVLKIISIPAYMQINKNPCSKVTLPQWIIKRIAETKGKQAKVTEFFQAGKSGITEKDIEDLTLQKLALPKLSKVKAKKRRHLEHLANQEQQDRETLEGKCPSATDDYVAFLQYNKALWRQDDVKRQVNKKIFGSNTSSKGSAIKNIIKKQAYNYVDDWQVLGYKQDLLGVIRAKVIINDKIQEMRIKVPKTIYVQPRNDGSVASLQAWLTVEEVPKAVVKSPGPVYKVVMAESEYLRRAGSLPKQFEVYEAEITGQQRSILELGTCVKFSNKEMGGLYKGLQEGFQWQDLLLVENPKYLKGFSFDLVYLNHMILNLYEIYTVFRDQHVDVLVLKPNDRAEEFNFNLASMYKQEYLKFDGVAKYMKFHEDVTFDNTYFSSLSSLSKKLNNKLASIYEEKSASCMLVLQSPFKPRLLRSLKSLEPYPILNIKHQEISLPSLNWQQAAFKNILGYYFSLDTWLADFIQLSKQSNIPICNIDPSNINFLIDIEYARRLQRANILLWWNRPSPQQDPLTFPNINIPENYTNVMVEISVQNLILNSLLTSSLLEEQYDLADNSYGSLAVLKTLIKDWWDLAIGKSYFADIMLNNFIGWIQFKGSYLYDSALQYHIFNLTKNSIYQLLVEFKKLGSQTIFANQNRLLLKTSKVSIENCYAYANYIIKVIRSKPLFNYLDLRIVKYWDVLVWMDQYNHSGIYCLSETIEAGFKDQQQLIQQTDQHEAQLVKQMDASWNIAQYLPAIYQQEFMDWLNIYIDTIVRQKLSSEPAQDSEPLAFAGALKSRIKKLYSKQNSVILNKSFSEEYQFPKLPGSHITFSNPLLELIKDLSAVFSVSKQYNLESRVLRRELLSYLDIKEFSTEAVFKNPSVSLIVPQVYCQNCGFIKDIDFCKDQNVWDCQSCHEPFNKVSLEERLIDEFLVAINNFYTQDLKCEKCGKIRVDELSELCDCSGKWTGYIEKSEMLRRLQIFENIAQYFDLKLLTEVIEES